MTDPAVVLDDYPEVISDKYPTIKSNKHPAVIKPTEFFCPTLMSRLPFRRA